MILLLENSFFRRSPVPPRIFSSTGTIMSSTASLLGSVGLTSTSTSGIILTVVSLDIPHIFSSTGTTTSSSTIVSGIVSVILLLSVVSVFTPSAISVPKDT